MFGRTKPDFEQVVRDHRVAVTAFARSHVRNAAMVDDIVQETFIRVWRYLPSYRNEGSFEGWIIRICRNVAHDYVRKNPERDELTDVHSTVESHPEVRTDVMSAIDQLSSDHRQVVTLCLLLGYSYEEAAEILSIPIGTVRSRISRARENLHDQLADDYFSQRKIG
jgi:RNA polymerase sigma-70 factor (ECF subfamily)